MTKTVLFVILDDYAEWEGAYLSSAIRELTQSEVEVKTLSINSLPLKTIGGFTILPDYNLTTIPDEYLGLILIGGNSWKNKEANALFPIIEDALRQQKVIASICYAAEFMAANGFFNTVNHTSNGIEGIFAWKDHIYTNESAYRNTQSVRDGNFVSANGTASLEFARDTLRALNIVEEREISEWYALHKLGYCDMILQYTD